MTKTAITDGTAVPTAMHQQHEVVPERSEQQFTPKGTRCMALPTLHLTGKTDVISSAEAETMARIWQVVAVVDEIDRDMRKNLRASEQRGNSLEALGLAMVNLCTAAVALLPNDVAKTLLQQIAS